MLLGLLGAGRVHRVHLGRGAAGATPRLHLPAVDGWDVVGGLGRRAVEPLPLVAHAVWPPQLGDDPLGLVPTIYEQIGVGLPVNRRTHIGRQHAGHVRAVHIRTASPADLESPAVPRLMPGHCPQHATLKALLPLLARCGRALVVPRVPRPQPLDEFGHLRQVGGVDPALGAADRALGGRAVALRPQEAVPAEGVPPTPGQDGLAVELVTHGALPLAGKAVNVELRLCALDSTFSNRFNRCRCSGLSAGRIHQVESPCEPTRQTLSDLASGRALWLAAAAKMA
mmetsp:Transcript_138676/g.386732  ORF Transcript_138676/g.386732 Transcript_138676/m.386732 type:complete len:283 (-) Transcript_138676:1-849(-)